MMTSDFRTNSAGTNDWLKATAQLTIRAYTGEDETPRAQDTGVLSLEDFADTLMRANRSSDPHVPTSGTWR